MHCGLGQDYFRPVVEILLQVLLCKYFHYKNSGLVEKGNLVASN